MSVTSFENLKNDLELWQVSLTKSTFRFVPAQIFNDVVPVIHHGLLNERAKFKDVKLKVLHSTIKGNTEKM